MNGDADDCVILPVVSHSYFGHFCALLEIVLWEIPDDSCFCGDSRMIMLLLVLLVVVAVLIALIHDFSVADPRVFSSASLVP